MRSIRKIRFFPARHSGRHIRVSQGMQNAAYYRQRAEHIRLLARQSSGLHDELMRAAQDFEELADDLLHGAVEIRHPELMPQNKGD